MTAHSISRCVGPKVTTRAISTYTIAGFTGYVAANALGVVLATLWHLTLTERLIAFLAAPLAFIIVVTISSAIAGRERIVFYQTTCAAVAAVVTASLIADARVATLLDFTVVAIGTFLVFGRIGCLSVACCHGTLGRGVVYGPRHVAVGFFPRWSGRALWPVQAVEALASALLVVAALAVARTPGNIALIYIAGYAGVRFLLEFVRGDGARPYLRGLSEAQWVAVATSIACAMWRPNGATAALAAALVVAAGIAVATYKRRELLQPPHLVELDRILAAATDGLRYESSLGVAVSRHDLPDGRTDWILSSTHANWNAERARGVARAMWPAWKLVAGKTPGVMHVIRRLSEPRPLLSTKPSAEAGPPGTKRVGGTH